MTSMNARKWIRQRERRNQVKIEEAVKLATERERKELSNALAITKLEWERCPCGSPHCRYMQIKNMGAFNQGTGFLPAERMRLDAAFRALEEKEANMMRRKFS